MPQTLNKAGDIYCSDEQFEIWQAEGSLIPGMIYHTPKINDKTAVKVNGEIVQTFDADTKQDKLIFDTEPVEGSQNSITSGVVYKILQIAEGKTRAYVVNTRTIGNEWLDNSSLNIPVSLDQTFTDIAGKIIEVSQLKTGDIIYTLNYIATENGQPVIHKIYDRWVGNIAETELLLELLDADNPALENYYSKAELQLIRQTYTDDEGVQQHTGDVVIKVGDGYTCVREAINVINPDHEDMVFAYAATKPIGSDVTLQTAVPIGNMPVPGAIAAYSKEDDDINSLLGRLKTAAPKEGLDCVNKEWIESKIFYKHQVILTLTINMNMPWAPTETTPQGIVIKGYYLSTSQDTLSCNAEDYQELQQAYLHLLNNDFVVTYAYVGHYDPTSPAIVKDIVEGCVYGVYIGHEASGDHSFEINIKCDSWDVISETRGAGLVTGRFKLFDLNSGRLTALYDFVK